MRWDVRKSGIKVLAEHDGFGPRHSPYPAYSGAPSLTMRSKSGIVHDQFSSVQVFLWFHFECRIIECPYRLIIREDKLGLYLAKGIEKIYDHNAY